jgi:uncharacterized membrane protein
MAKRKGERKDTRSKDTSECDLDRGYTPPDRSPQILTVSSCTSAIRTNRYVQLLLGITLIGFFLRFWNLGFNSLWLDEASTYQISVKSFAEIWQVTAAGEFNPPLFYWIEHVMLMFGNSEAILRFIPALLGALSVPLFYVLGKEFLDRNTGLIAAAACAVSPFLIYYSQEARAYSVMLFLMAAATIFFLRAQKSQDYLNWALFGVFSALAFWVHFYAFVMISALVLFSLLQLHASSSWFETLKKTGAGILVFIVLSLPLILLTIQLFMKRTASAPTYGIQGPEVITATFFQLSGFSTPVMIVLLLLFAAGIIQAFLIDRNKGIFLGTILVFTCIVSYFLSFRMPMQPRYLIFLAIIFFLGIAVSYRLFFSFWNHPGVVYGFVAFLLVINILVLGMTGYYTGYTKEDWRGFAGTMQNATRPGDQLVFVPGYMSQPFDYYYSNSSDGTFEYGASSATELEALSAQRGNSTQYYIMTTDIGAADPAGTAIAWLKAHAQYIGNVNGIYIFASG